MPKQAKRRSKALDVKSVPQRSNPRRYSVPKPMTKSPPNANSKLNESLNQSMIKAWGVPTGTWNLDATITAAAMADTKTAKTAFWDFQGQKYNNGQKFEDQKEALKFENLKVFCVFKFLYYFFQNSQNRKLLLR